MAGHESAGLELVSTAGASIWLDIQSRDLGESDPFGRDVRRYAVNGAALLLEGNRGVRWRSGIARTLPWACPRIDAWWTPLDR